MLFLLLLTSWIAPLLSSPKDGLSKSVSSFSSGEQELRERLEEESEEEDEVEKTANMSIDKLAFLDFLDEAVLILEKEKEKDKGEESESPPFLSLFSLGGSLRSSPIPSDDLRQSVQIGFFHAAGFDSGTAKQALLKVERLERREEVVAAIREAQRGQFWANVLEDGRKLRSLRAELFALEMLLVFGFHEPLSAEEKTAIDHLEFAGLQSSKSVVVNFSQRLRVVSALVEMDVSVLYLLVHMLYPFATFKPFYKVLLARFDLSSFVLGHFLLTRAAPILEKEDALSAPLSSSFPSFFSPCWTRLLRGGREEEEEVEVAWAREALSEVIGEDHFFVQSAEKVEKRLERGEFGVFSSRGELESACRTFKESVWRIAERG